MNSFSHFFINYLVLNRFFDAKEYYFLILVSSTLVDLDHIPYIFRNKKTVVRDGLNVHCRSFLHELTGFFLLSFVLGLGYIMLWQPWIIIVWLCFLIHFSVDYLTGITRPFSPFSKMTITSPLQKLKRKHRIIIETTITVILGVLFLYEF